VQAARSPGRESTVRCRSRCHSGRRPGWQVVVVVAEPPMARGFDCVDFPFFLVNSCVIVGDVDCGGGVPEKKNRLWRRR
jgi:hypothetical protein